MGISVLIFQATLENSGAGIILSAVEDLLIGIALVGFTR